MATVKIALKNKKNAKLQYPIVFRIYHEGDSAEIYSKIYVHRSEWSAVTNMISNKHPQYKKIKAFLNDMQDRIYEEINLLQTSLPHFNSKDVKKNFEGSVMAKKNAVQKNEFDFIRFLQSWIDEKKISNPGNAKVTKDTLNTLKRFGYDHLSFKEIDAVFVHKYEKFLTKTHRSPTVRLRSLKARYNEAVRLGLGDDLRPFSSTKISNKPVEGHEYLNAEEIAALKAFKYNEHKGLLLSYCTFMFSYFTFGTNFKDLIRFKRSNIKSETIEYVREKTKKELILPRLPEVDVYLKVLEDNLLLGDLYLFPYLSDFHKSEQQKYYRATRCLKKYNSDLKQIASICNIDTNISSYVARHSMANTLKSGSVPITVIQQVLGHEDIRVTEGYLKNFNIQVMTDALRNKL